MRSDRSVLLWQQGDARAKAARGFAFGAFGGASAFGASGATAFFGNIWRAREALAGQFVFLVVDGIGASRAERSHHFSRSGVHLARRGNFERAH
jgi:hypothetical protein